MRPPEISTGHGGLVTTPNGTVTPAGKSSAAGVVEAGFAGAPVKASPGRRPPPWGRLPRRDVESQHTSRSRGGHHPPARSAAGLRACPAPGTVPVRAAPHLGASLADGGVEMAQVSDPIASERSVCLHRTAGAALSSSTGLVPAGSASFYHQATTSGSDADWTLARPIRPRNTRLVGPGLGRTARLASRPRARALWRWGARCPK